MDEAGGALRLSGVVPARGARELSGPGKVAAAVVATMFVVLAAGTVILFRWLTHQ